MTHPSHNKLFQTLAIWFLSVALLFGANMSLLAGSMVDDGSERILLCTPSGLKWVDLNSPEGEDLLESACPWCRLDDDTGVSPVLLSIAVQFVAVTRHLEPAAPNSATTVRHAPPDPTADPGSPRAPPPLFV